MADLTNIAHLLVAPDKGVLAADESTATITKRFDKLGIESTAESRRDYRELLITTPELGQCISGVILYDETIRQTASDGMPMPEVLRSLGMLPGIKVDTGAKPLAGAPGETITEGLDGLRDRIAEYLELGARFAKWRAVFAIGDGCPTRRAVVANAHALARYAALCQEGGLVPIVEPEVLMEGQHSLERCFETTGAILEAVFGELRGQRVALDAMVLKANMVIAGAANPESSGVDAVAQTTLRCLRREVPPAVPGVAFLSGGQGAELATAHLNAMNAIGAVPWDLSFSYGRALQDPALRAWKGKTHNVHAAQEALSHRARCNAAARAGSYTPDMEER